MEGEAVKYDCNKSGAVGGVLFNKKTGDDLFILVIINFSFKITLVIIIINFYNNLCHMNICYCIHIYIYIFFFLTALMNFHYMTIKL